MAPPPPPPPQTIVQSLVRWRGGGGVGEVPSVMHIRCPGPGLVTYEAISLEYEEEVGTGNWTHIA